MLFNNKFLKYILCFAFILLFGLFVDFSNASAVSVSTSSFDLHYTTSSDVPYQWQNGILYGSSNGITIPFGGGANIYQFTTEPVQAGGNSASIHFETNIVASWYYAANFNPWVNLLQQNVIVCNSSPSASSTISRNLSSVTTLWGNSESNTLTLYGDVTVTGLTAGTTYQFVCAVGSTDYSFIDIPSLMGAANIWFEQNPMTISWFTDESQALMQTQINQNQIIINQSNEYYDKTYESVDNISDQTTSDIPDSENQTSSNLINALAGFTSAISSITIANDCTFTLPFPSYAGGDVPVNLCQYKEKAPEIVLTFGSITLIAVAVGFWIRCIISLYRLIRSFIDGIDDGHYIDIEVID